VNVLHVARSANVLVARSAARVVILNAESAIMRTSHQNLDQTSAMAILYLTSASRQTLLQHPAYDLVDGARRGSVDRRHDAAGKMLHLSESGSGLKPDALETGGPEVTYSETLCCQSRDRV
jgi:hypothetical protein